MNLTVDPAESGMTRRLLCRARWKVTPRCLWTGAELSVAHIQERRRSSGTVVVLVVVVSKAQQSLVSDSSVQSLPASLQLGPPAERDVVFWERGRW